MSWSASGNRFLQPVWDLNDPDALLALLSRFLEYGRIKGYSAQTLYGYERYLRDFIVWGQGRGVLRAQDLTLPNIVQYQVALTQRRTRKGTPLAKLSLISKLIPLRSFLRWLARAFPLLRTVLADMDLPKVTRRIPKHVCSANDVGRILRSANPACVLGLRDRAILELLYSTGMRRMELVHLDIDDLDLERSVVIIRHGKGDRARVVPVGRQALDWIDEYLDRGRPRVLKQPTDRLFLSKGGRPLSASWLSGLVGGYIARAKIGKHGACHLLRHSMATLMLENGADIRFIQEMLGHAQLSTTQIYTHVSVAQLHRVYTATHPSERVVKRSTPIAHRSSPRNMGPKGVVASSPHPIETELLELIRDLPATAGWKDVLKLVETKSKGVAEASP